MFLVGALVGLILWIIGTILIAVYRKKKDQKLLKEGEINK